MLSLPWIVGVVASMGTAIGYIVYNVQSKKKQSTPNSVSWFIWALMAGLNASSFVGVTDVPHALQYMVGTFASIVTFLLVLGWGRFDWPKPVEWIVLIFCIVTIAVWWVYRDANVANAIILVTFFLSFWPTFEGVRKDPHNETAMAWWIWTTAFVVNLFNNALSWNGNWMSVINPITMILCHGSIAYLSREVRKQRFPLPS